MLGIVDARCAHGAGRTRPVSALTGLPTTRGSRSSSLPPTVTVARVCSACVRRCAPGKRQSRRPHRAVRRTKVRSRLPWTWREGALGLCCLWLARVVANVSVRVSGLPGSTGGPRPDLYFRFIPLDRLRMPVFHLPDLGGNMRAVRSTLRALLVVLRLALNVTVAVARTVTVCLLWLVAPRACLAVTLLRPRKR